MGNSVNQTTPRLFWTNVGVRLVNGDWRLWRAFAKAKANGPGDYDMEVNLYGPILESDNDRLRASADFTIWRNEAGFKGRDWGVGVHTLKTPGAVTRYDGNDFPSLRAAAWMCIEKVIEEAMNDIRNAHNRIEANATGVPSERTLIAWKYQDDERLGDNLGKFAPNILFYEL